MQMGQDSVILVSSLFSRLDAHPQRVILTQRRQAYISPTRLRSHKPSFPNGFLHEKSISSSNHHLVLFGKHSLFTSCCRQESLKSWNGETMPPTMPTLEQWLTDHPHVADHIVWEMPNLLTPPSSVALPWAEWPDSYKQKLQDNFHLYGKWNEVFSKWRKKWTTSDFNPSTVHYFKVPSTTIDADPWPVKDPPENLHIGDGWTIMDSPAAFDLYIKHVAMILAVEIGHFVPWSILKYDRPSVRQLLDGRKTFKWQLGGPEFGGINKTGHLLTTYVVPAPPTITASFLGIHRLIGKTPFNTIYLVLNWARSNLHHFAGGEVASGKQLGEVYWQYKGTTPVSRMINGTEASEAVGGYWSKGIHHWTAGCPGTTGFLREVLRVVNIPVQEIDVGHKLPHFTSVGLALSHGDDPYELAPEIPIDELPISQSTFKAWFLDDPNPTHNVSRRVAELTLQYLPLQLLDKRCLDISKGNTDHANSTVYLGYFTGVYSVAELEALQLWEKMDEKINSLGGCQKIPHF
jgi:hypothetical protein